MTLAAATPGERARRLAGWVWLAVGTTLIGAPASSYADPSDEYSEVVAQDEDYAAGRAAVERKDWGEATKRLARAAVRHPDNADLHNYLGYSYRQLKQFDRAFEHYKRAIAIEPRHRGAHEYIGEAYLALDDLANAREHLKRLDKLCFFSCEAYRDLKKAVEAYEKSGGTVKPATAR